MPPYAFLQQHKWWGIDGSTLCCTTAPTMTIEQRHFIAVYLYLLCGRRARPAQSYPDTPAAPDRCPRSLKDLSLKTFAWHQDGMGPGRSPSMKAWGTRNPACPMLSREGIHTNLCLHARNKLAWAQARRHEPARDTGKPWARGNMLPIALHQDSAQCGTMGGHVFCPIMWISYGGTCPATDDPLHLLTPAFTFTDVSHLLTHLNHAAVCTKFA